VRKQVSDHATDQVQVLQINSIKTKIKQELNK